MHCESSKSGEDDFYDIRAAYVLVCLLQETHNSAKFLLSKCSMKNFFSYSISLFVRASRLFQRNIKNNQTRTDNAILAFVKLGSVMFQKFKRKYQESVSSPKRVA